MIKRFFLALGLWAIFQPSFSQTQVDFYVAPTGSDQNSGSSSAPFATLAKAKQAVLEQRKASPDAAFSIILKNGAYYLNGPVTFGPADSGREKTPLVIRAEEKGQAVISGAKVLNLQWKPYQGEVLVAKVPKGLVFSTLSFAGKPQILARYPNYQAGVYPYGGFAEDALSPERIKSWKSPAGGLIHALHQGRWGGMHYQITGKNPDGTLAYEGGWQNNRESEMHQSMRFVENIFEELDSQGEWYLDTKKSLLYYFPTAEMEIENLKTAEVSILENLLSFEGTRENPVHDIQVSGIKFVQTAPTFMKTEEPLMRSDWTVFRGGAIFLQGTERVAISDSELVHLGGNAIFVSKYNRDTKVSGNHIYQIGGSAISFVGSPDALRSPSFNYHEFVDAAEMDTIPGPKTDEYPARSLAFDNLIHDIGLIEKQVAGVQIQLAMDLRIAHNTIYNVPRAGINIGDGAWGGHVIEYNDVFNTVMETGDHGAFNSWGRDRFWHPNRKIMDSLAAEHPEWIRLDAIKTTFIRSNRFHCDHGWDIDLDDGSSNYEIYNNLCLSGGLKLREGFYRAVYNNITVNNGFHPHVWFQDSHDVFTRNIVMTPHKQIGVNFWGDKVDQNFFTAASDLDKSRALGVEANGMIGDPEFVDPKSGDFSVKETSPAKVLGFENFDMDRFGVVDARLKAKAASPKIPALFLQMEGKGEELVDWHGFRIKTVETLGEQSAAGINEMRGVLVVGVPENHQAGDDLLQKGDVILVSWGEEIQDVVHLLKVEKGNAWKGGVELKVWRNQALHPVRLKK